MAFDMEQYNKWPANHKNDKEPSKKIIALGKKITDVAGHMIGGVKVEDPEYWGLAEIITEEMADVGLKMKKRTPYTFAEMCKLNGITKDEEKKFQKLLDEMSYIGLLEYDYGYHYDHNGRTKEQTERRYILPMFVPGSAELFNMEELPDGSNPRLKEHPDVAAFFERMTFLPLAGITQMVPPGGAGIGMHVIPVEKAISMENQSVDLEHLSYWLKNMRDTSVWDAAPAVHRARRSARVLRTTITAGVSVSAISRITAVRPERDTILPMMRRWRSYSAPRRTALCTRSPILTVRTRSSVSVTVM